MNKTAPLNIFVVHNDPFFLQLMYDNLLAIGQSSVYLFDNSSDCILHLPEKPDVIFIDYRMDNLDGIEIMKKIHRYDHDIVVIFVFDQNSIEQSIDVLLNGAFDHIGRKDVSYHALELLMQRIVRFKKRMKLLQQHQHRDRNPFRKFLRNTGLL